MGYVDGEDLQKEVKFLMKLNHLTVVQVKGICLSESCMMMEFMILDHMDRIHKFILLMIF